MHVQEHTKHIFWNNYSRIHFQNKYFMIHFQNTYVILDQRFRNVRKGNIGILKIMRCIKQKKVHKTIALMWPPFLKKSKQCRF